MKRRLVLIEWWDSVGCGTTWSHLPEKEPKPQLIRSVGWLVVDGKRSKIVVPHLQEGREDLSTSDSGCGDMLIPTCSVKRIVDLVEK